MRLKWREALQHLFAAAERPTSQRSREIANFGIGFCPGCKRLRGVSSLRCTYCGSAAPVTADA